MVSSPKNLARYGDRSLFLVFVNLVFDTKVTLGDANGGGDGKILPADLWNHGHIVQTFVLLTSGSVFFLYQIRHGHFLTIQIRNLLAPTIFVAFLFLWNFDLGWKQDLDLIIASSVILLWTDNQESPKSTKKISRRSQLVLFALAANMWLVLGQVGWIFI